MSIDRTQATKPVSTVQPRETHDAATSKVRQSESAKTSEAGTQVKLSDAQSQLMKPGSQDINLARVEQLKSAIRNGELKMDSGKIADALIQETKDYLQGN
ncbi:flagellar biosynthesis anti-sigma factor FlgM [Winslowiella iniecta]|uniref:Negative regulator of flagellin synthesis n=1 Tax=Winslowiella iniecta TaxID=1560201 RepID=A0A0L7TIJ9_9GAMM|nr:flagellar biosynthesis anti-sigma factor FlgM [Winslowiella iniecta]KOC91796.1 flagellar biosynthesis anti-sigma factor FlgM [Winslowiella iniecta]KOC95076.1 flagellar biosynthesis anti-sigma factor FlgM [Winslowiella iniecta]